MYDGIPVGSGDILAQIVPHLEDREWSVGLQLNHRKCRLWRPANETAPAHQGLVDIPLELWTCDSGDTSWDFGLCAENSSESAMVMVRVLFCTIVLERQKVIFVLFLPQHSERKADSAFFSAFEVQNKAQTLLGDKGKGTCKTEARDHRGGEN